ncbi:MAG: VUT family protein [Bacteroidetes bacterium]|nr:VUT family protein [Bacteroidota bacterium]
MKFHILLYVVSIIAANYTATWFLPFTNLIPISVGTLIFGITFTQRDKIHFLGRKRVYTIIFATALLNSILSVFWEIPNRILLASFLSITISEITDTEVYQAYIKKHWFVRILRSNIVSIPIDSALFNLIAFYAIYSSTFIVGLILGEIIVKSSVSIIYAVLLKKYFLSS